MREFLTTVANALKDKPALHSFCLSNEPTMMGANGCVNTKALWVAYLTRTHGDIATLNARYATSYKSFEDVPFAGNNEYEAPQYYDWITLNNERLAAWHEWAADVIHESAPSIPVHVKIMGLVHFNHMAAGWGVDPELFGKLSDINGNDDASWPVTGTWGIDWWDQNVFYDLQRSLNRKPIFNSENHIAGDLSTDYYHPNSFREALWQGAIHGQSATTLWVWERTYDRGYPFYGSVMHRAGCAEMVGLTTLDLNRFAGEVTALQNVKAPVAILYSPASMAKTRAYMDDAHLAYTALNFTGVKVDFISEKQLAAGKGREYRILVLAGAENVLPATVEALKKLSGQTRLVFLGNSLARDPYGKPYPEDEIAAIRAKALALDDKSDAQRGIWPTLMREMDRLGANSDVRVLDAATWQPVWGVEWLPAKVKGHTIINMVNLRYQQPVKVRIVAHGKAVEARDLLSLGGRERASTLQPLTPVLAEVE